ncbi:probable glycerol-3-phosphate acyltransferase 3 [Hordeum vulgare subsp. vulgare]|uniref:probable glycerol-3-phosphate acyltransferase 3 n=1 Tax=Hordeum vulgare subsp. vulgare TaxID=112509 RepID=UPI001D1A526C|nr:probable glycerol-3-phosphate acyltransferase 3 [Hordeum vulgare subsp. vulgare]
MARNKKQRLFSALLSLALHRIRPPTSSRATDTAVTESTPHPSSLHHHGNSSHQSMAEKLAAGRTLVLDVDDGLLLPSSSSPFPYFMLVALEAGGYIRGLVLLLLYPIILCIGGDSDAAVRMMAMAAFCGLRAGPFLAGRAVLPKWLMEDVAAEGLETMRMSGGRRVCVARKMPRLMVEGFLREYLGAESVVGKEMKVLWGFYTGLMEEEDKVMLEEKIMLEGNDAVGFSGSLEFLQHPLSRCCKNVYLVTKDEKATWQALPRSRYPKALVFHDGRLAFRPTAGSTIAMFTWLPFGVALGAARLAVALTVPYRYSTPIRAASGMSWRLKVKAGDRPTLLLGGDGERGRRRGQLYVCNHRTLIDPVYISVALDRPVRAVSYSLSRFSDLLSPIGRTVRLARDRDVDACIMGRLLDSGDLLVVSPEGTTCREPYLLRFSPLFAELSDDVVPVGLATETGMFYATTAGGLKFLDSLYYMVNPRMCYTVQFLERVSTSAVRERKVTSADVANLVQRKMGDALGYGCTMFNRKDKYRLLAGNDGKCSIAPAATIDLTTT